MISLISSLSTHTIWSLNTLSSKLYKNFSNVIKCMQLWFISSMIASYYGYVVTAKRVSFYFSLYCILSYILASETWPSVQCKSGPILLELATAIKTTVTIHTTHFSEQWFFLFSAGNLVWTTEVKTSTLNTNLSNLNIWLNVQDN
jgi:hypothetical protein